VGAAELLDDEAQIAPLGIARAHVGLGHVERLGDGLFDRALAEAELDRLVQRRDAALKQVRNLVDFVVGDLAQQVGQNRGQLEPARGVLERFEAFGQGAETKWISQESGCAPSAQARIAATSG
jgi:hypothetical protein